MKRAFVLFVLLAALLPDQLSAAGSSRVDSLADKVDALFAEWDRPDSPGCALAVIRDGQVVYARGYGLADLEHDVPITPQTVFYIGSTSKQFVAACVLLLEEQGKLSLDDDLRRFVPEFPQYDRPITLRHLIHHTSGIRDYLTLWSLTGRSYLDDLPEQAVLDLICRQKELNFSPGEKFLYSNSCYFLLAVVVERASGKSLREFAQEQIFEPLGMNHSHFHDDNQHLIKNRAFGYLRREDGTFGNLIMRFDLVGSGGLYTTVEDLARWDRNFYDNRLGRSGPQFIERMLQNGRLHNGEEVDYAFALRHGTYRGAKTVSHGGALGGYRAQLLRFPEHRLSVAILSNLASFNPTAMARKVADLYLAEHLGPPEPERTEPRRPESRADSVSLSPAELQAYAGEFDSEELQVRYRLSVEDGRLFLQIPNNEKRPLTAVDRDVFEGRVRLRFERDRHGRVTGFRLDAGRVQRLAFVKRR